MAEIGYALSSEEHNPNDLVRHAHLAAKRIAYEWWPQGGVSGQMLSADMPTPAHFDALVKNVKEEDVAKSVTCSADPQKHVEAIKEFTRNGFDHVYVHQVGPDQAGFIRFYQREVLPLLK